MKLKPYSINSAKLARFRADRIRKAGKHKCVRILGATVSQITSGSKTLKRPKVLARFYECKICGRDMI
jgi:hypothetical protein